MSMQKESAGVECGSGGPAVYPALATSLLALDALLPRSSTAMGVGRWWTPGRLKRWKLRDTPGSKRPFRVGALNTAVDRPDAHHRPRPGFLAGLRLVPTDASRQFPISSASHARWRAAIYKPAALIIQEDVLFVHVHVLSCQRGFNKVRAVASPARNPENVVTGGGRELTAALVPPSLSPRALTSLGSPSISGGKT
ncbi:hypothetical protein BGZ61DRAFT_560960 [Ilyonectria robusta]|uniref:uncharacterized protein n=1 Tax=Ilyonectria robusta TaxID=1079257 RepID=UPI001E8D05D9|nr:uncharacterized protein BGZ61DRAFT_560960 [Ilyonectria robusta]KAH8735214.1 hypothetical protein BGZ61DRAFT_560960 [Ilyonectria robusta]